MIENKQQISNQTTEGMLEHALQYASKGWPVLPLHTPDMQGQCSCHKADCKSAGKHPRTMNGLKEATTNEAMIRRWWERWPEANIGIATGSDAGFVVLDVDPRNGGNKTLATLELENGLLPDTRTSNTGGDGRHFLFSPPEGKLPKTAGEGLDIKGDGGYIVAPPSLHASGKRYEWASNSPIAEMPAWLMGRLTEKKVAASTGPNLSDSRQVDISTLTGLDAETRRRILAHESVNISGDKQWAQARGLCHGGKGNTAVYVNIASGAYGCHKGCTREAIREAFGLPSRPVGKEGPAMGPSAPLGQTWRDFSAQEFPEADNIIVGLERCEVGLLVAATNIGKTTLALNIALSLAAGKEFKPITKDEEGSRKRVLVIDGETRRARMQRDIRTMECGWSNAEKELVKDNLYVMCDSEFEGVALSLSNEKHMEAVRAEAQQFKPDLIIVDTLVELFTVASENDNAEMQNKVMRPLNQLAKDTNAAVLVLHHIGKMSEEAQSGTQAYRGRGASSVGGSARLVLLLKPDTKERLAVTLSCAKSKGDYFEDVLMKLEPSTRWFNAIDTSSATKQSSYQRVFMTVLDFKRPVRRMEVEEAFGETLSSVTIGRHLKEAVRRGVLVSPRQGLYQTPEFNHSVNTLSVDEMTEPEGMSMELQP